MQDNSISPVLICPILFNPSFFFIQSLCLSNCLEFDKKKTLPVCNIALLSKFSLKGVPKKIFFLISDMQYCLHIAIFKLHFPLYTLLNALLLVPQRPSRHHSDTILTLYRHHPDRLWTYSRQHSDILQTLSRQHQKPFRHHSQTFLVSSTLSPDTLQIQSRYCPSIVQTPFKHLADSLLTPYTSKLQNINESINWVRTEGRTKG